MLIIRKSLAFLRKDLLVQTSYGVVVLSSFFVTALAIASYFFLSRLFAEANLPAFQQYGNGYFSFVLIGIACYHYTHVALASFAGGIRQAQIFGTLEAMLLTRTSLRTIVFLSSLWTFLSSLLQIVLYVLLGWLIFDLDLSRMNLASTILMLLWIALSLCPFGILAASFVLAFKRSEPVFMVVSGLSGLLGGVYYPTSVLPKPLLWIAKILPITDGVDGLRRALCLGESWSDLRASFFRLACLAVVFYPLSFLILSLSIRRARKNGTLGEY